MTEKSLAALRRLLVLRYDNLKLRLTRRLGSADLAHEVLHETWLRLESSDSVAAVQSHEGYLFRAAMNTALDRHRAEQRRLTAAEVEGLLEIVDESPDPAQIAEARSDLRAAQAIMLGLPPRQYAILLAARLEGLTRREIAKRFRISVRLVQRELQEAQDYCTIRFKRLNVNPLFTSDLRETSLNGNLEPTAGFPERSGDQE
jgi:RNA polymerase sigma-70 factor (ECF subfamily)